MQSLWKIFFIYWFLFKNKTAIHKRATPGEEKHRGLGILSCIRARALSSPAPLSVSQPDHCRGYRAPRHWKSWSYQYRRTTSWPSWYIQSRSPCRRYIRPKWWYKSAFSPCNSLSGRRRCRREKSALEGYFLSCTLTTEWPSESDMTLRWYERGNVAVRFRGRNYFGWNGKKETSVEHFYSAYSHYF